MYNCKLESIRAVGYRSVDDNIKSIKFSDAKKNAILIGPNGSGKSNVLKAFSNRTESPDDEPLGDTEEKKRIYITLRFEGAKLTLNIDPISKARGYFMSENEKQKILLKIDSDELDSAKKEIEELCKIKKLHASKSESDLVNALTEILSNTNISLVSNFDKWKSSLELSNSKLTNPDSFTRYILDELSNTYKDHLKSLLSNAPLTPAQRTNLKKQINTALAKLTKPLKELEVEVDDTLSVSGGLLKFITTQEDLAVPLSHRSDGEIMLVSFLLFLNEYQVFELKSPQIFMFDELETTLDPSNQMLASKLLTKLPEKAHAVFSTHSPYLFFEKRIREKSNIYIVKKSEHSTSIKLVEHSEEFKLTYPSWAELNYVAYSIPSLEYHNLLFGQSVQDHGSIKEADIFLKSKDFPTRLYKELGQNGEVKQRQCYHAPECGNHDTNSPSDQKCLTLPTYIRHKSHHPENTNNPNYSQRDLEASIKKLRKFV